MRILGLNPGLQVTGFAVLEVAAVGPTLPDAAAAVPHGQIRVTTVGAIRAAGGEVCWAPDLSRHLTMNRQHVNITEAGPSVFLMPTLSEADFAGSWADLWQRAVRKVGDVPVSAVRFDPTKRAVIDAEAFDSVRPTAAPVNGTQTHAQPPTHVS